MKNLQIFYFIAISYSFSIYKPFEALFVDPMDKFISNLKDDEWKNVRAILSTTFTSGKLKEVLKIFLFLMIIIIYVVHKT